ncbi:MAG: 2-dehydropantoate 2-reductase [Verrucomicrobiota bacterium]
MSTHFPEKPRIAIIGAGALGCYYGARLVTAGEDVHFLARSGRAALMVKGLKVKTPTEKISVRKIQVYGSAHEIGPCDLVIIATKATANEALKTILPPLLKPDTAVLTLQNGLGVEEPVADIVGPARVLGAICYIGCMRTAPGVVDCSFPGLMTIGKFGKPAGERTQMIASLWRRAGVKCTAQDNLELQRWHKLVWNVPFNGLSIVSGGITTDVIIADEGLRLMARRLMEEVVEAAAKFGHVISRSFVDLQFERTAKMGGYRPSSLIDFEEGRDMEIEEIWGEPVRRAKQVGATVPRMEMLYWLIRQRLEARNAKLKAKSRKR